MTLPGSPYVTRILGNGPTTMNDGARLLLHVKSVHKMLQGILVCLGGLPESNHRRVCARQPQVHQVLASSENCCSSLGSTNPAASSTDFVPGGIRKKKQSLDSNRLEIR